MDRTRHAPKWLDPAARERIEAEFNRLIAALDRAGEPTAETIEDVRRATDGLMRAAARIRLILEARAGQ
jgi:hypothetical protein